MIVLSRKYLRIVEAVLVLGVFVAALFVFFSARTKLDSDEVNKIGTTHFFESYFVQRDFSAETWADSHWTRTQPMVLRYLIGGWLWLRGHDLKALNPNYDYSKSEAANRRLGLVPPDEVVEDARMPTRLMAALAVTMLYLVVRALAGPVGGLVASFIALRSPYLEEHLIRAMAESTLMFFLLTALLSAILSVSRLHRPGPAARWGVATGVLLGLALGTKLTAVLVLVAVALWGAGICLDDLVRHAGGWRAWLTSPTPWRRRAAATEHPTPSQRMVWVWPVSVLAAAGFVFLASNPFLWRDPVGRTWLLFENRRAEMAQQQKDVPSRAVHGLDDRAALVWTRSAIHDAFGPSRLRMPLEAVLAVVGAIWLTARAMRPGYWRPCAERLVLLWLACLWIGISLGIGFLLRHYFVPTATIVILLSGLAIGWSVQAAGKLARRVIARRPVPQPAALEPQSPYGALTMERDAGSPPLPLTGS